MVRGLCGMHSCGTRASVSAIGTNEMSNRVEECRFRVNISGGRGIYLIHKGMSVVVF